MQARARIAPNTDNPVSAFLATRPGWIEVTGVGTDVAPVTLAFGPLTVNAVELPDQAAPSAWTYGSAEAEAGQDPRRL